MGVGVSAVPTPLYPLYERQDLFGSATVTVVFAAFSISVAGSLVFLGPLSDRVGRRATLIPALLLDAVSCLLFIAWPSLPGLLVARALCGLSVGVIAASATAYLSDLQEGALPPAGRRHAPRPEVLATAANLGGVGVGALAAGILAEFAPAPLRLPYFVYLGLLLVTVALLSRLPSRPQTQALPRRRLLIRPPAHPRRAYLAAAVGALLALSSLGLFASLAPSFLRDVLHERSHALAGGLACIAFVSAATGQLLTGRLRGRWGSHLGYGAILAGVTLMTVGLWSSQTSLFVASGVCTGMGSGLVFKRCLGIAVDAAPPDARAESSAGIFLSSYLGLAASIVGLGILTTFTTSRVALLVFATAVSLGVLVALLLEPSTVSPRGRHTDARC